jgi:hypothetical protein
LSVPWILRRADDNGKIAEHAETHDFADDISEREVWEADIESDPMVTTSLRLPTPGRIERLEDAVFHKSAS